LLRKRVEGGGTTEQHLRRVQEVTGKVPRELADRVDLPGDFRYLWEWYLEIGLSRQHGMSGAQPLLYSEILAWSHLTGVRLQHWEVRALRALDMGFMEIAHG
jgi:hypothetical protein